MLPTNLGSISLFVSASLIGLATYYDIHDDKNIPLPLLHFFFIVCVLSGYGLMLNWYAGIGLFALYYLLCRFFENGEAEAWLFGGIGFLLGPYALAVVALAHITALPTAFKKMKEVAFCPYILLSFGLVCLGLLLFR
jgi:hypothetical protein